jgi:hypothetical protein
MGLLSDGLGKAGLPPDYGIASEETNPPSPPDRSSR